MSRPNFKINFSVNGPILPGSISIAYLPCGKKSCACFKNKNKRHGPYYRWSGFIDGKRTTRNISKSDMVECKKRIANYQKLVALWDKHINHALLNAPWNIMDRHSSTPP